MSIKYKIVLVAIICKKDEILLVKRHREPFLGKWSLPGGWGALEREKDPFKAIKSEIENEVNAKFNWDFYTASFEEQPEPTLKLFFKGTIDKEPKSEMFEFKWAKIKDLVENSYDLAFNDLDIVRKFYKDTSL
jgi:ADP-ribose pyrophosphatase YjhB (NUDIX family)